MNAVRADMTVCVPVRNDASRLRTCLDALGRGRGHAKIEVIVADNGSTDESAAVAAAAGATVVSLPDLRVGELRNMAATKASAALIAFVDADHVVDVGWVSAALAVFGDPAVAAAGAPYSAGPAANWIQRAYDRLRPILSRQQPTEWLGSGNLIVRRAAFVQVGGFDAALESCEDVDLCNRLRNAGHRLVADPRLRSVHQGDPATLRALFFGELWRGRDNIKVSLRGPITAAALPSLLIPVVHLICLVALAGAVWAGAGVAIAAGVVFGSMTLLRAARMSMGRSGLTPRDLAANGVVAGVYDLARALSLVARATHRTRRETAGERAVA